jgi:hypothetical protein
MSSSLASLAMFMLNVRTVHRHDGACRIPKQSRTYALRRAWPGRRAGSPATPPGEGRRGHPRRRITLSSPCRGTAPLAPPAERSAHAAATPGAVNRGNKAVAVGVQRSDALFFCVSARPSRQARKAAASGTSRCGAFLRTRLHALEAGNCHAVAAHGAGGAHHHAAGHRLHCVRRSARTQHSRVAQRLDAHHGEQQLRCVLSRRRGVVVFSRLLA